MKIVIIEDEPKTARDLAKTILSILPQAEIVCNIESVEEGKLYFQNSTDIDLIFSDIQLGDGLSFEIFEEKKGAIPIIFCTAYNEYALQAFKTFGIDYILKPFSTANIRQAIEKYQTLAFKNNPPKTSAYMEIMEAIKQQLNPNSIQSTTILIFRGDKIIPIEIEKIAILCIDNAIVYAFSFEGQKLSTNYKLDDLEQKLSPQFFRANRQFLINRKAVKEASQSFHRKLEVHFHVPFSETVFVGKEKVSVFLDWLTR